MKTKNVLKYIILSVLIALIPILFFVLIKEYKSYKYEIELAKITANYNDKQQECECIGLTNNYVYVSRTDENGKPIRNSKWKVISADGLEIGSFTTNNEGNGGLIGFGYGEYYIQEISVPENFELDKQKYRIIVSAVDTSFEFVITDMAKKNAILLVVKDADLKPVKDGQYDIYSQNNQYIKTVTTNEMGLAGVKNIPNGVYYIVQKNIPNSKKHYIAIDNLEDVERIDLIYNQGDEF